jgi:hypothetical protein
MSLRVSKKWTYTKKDRVMKNLFTLTLLLTRPFKTTITSPNAPLSLRGKTLTIDFCFTDEELRTDRDYKHAPIAKAYLDNNRTNPTQIVYFGLDTNGVQ